MTTEAAEDPDPVATGTGLSIGRKSYPSARRANAKLKPSGGVEI
jgi:hypothetical protein